MKNIVRTYFEPYRRSVLFIIILLILQVIFQIMIIYLIKPIIAEGIKVIDTETIITYGTLMLILISCYSATTVIIAHKSARISAESVSRIRDDMFKKVFSFKRPRDSGANMSGLINRLVTDVNNIQDFITEFLCMGLYVPMLAIGVIITTAIWNPSLCVALTISFIVMILLTIHLSKDMLKIRSKIQRLLDRTIHLFRELIIGSRTSRAFDLEKGQFEAFSQQNKDYSDMITDISVRVGVMSSLSTFILITVIVVSYGLLMFFFDGLSIAPSDVVIFVQYLVLFISCASITPFIVTTIPQVKMSFGRISKVMNGESEQPGDDIPQDCEGPLLVCSNGLVVDKGIEMSLVGRSGAGKSELIRSLLRLEDVKPGTIFYKGKDITDLDPKQLRSSIAYAGRLAMAFKGSVRDNVQVWRDISDERLREVLAAAKIDLELDAVLDHFGSNISIGQIQKISIARALASDADLYIFDDCFTEMDPKTENEIVSNIRGMLRGKTVLFLSHQFRISPGSDGVSVMDQGKIIDSGTHEDLIDRCEIYRRMYLTGGGVVD